MIPRHSSLARWFKGSRKTSDKGVALKRAKVLKCNCSPGTKESQEGKVHGMGTKSSFNMAKHMTKTIQIPGSLSKRFFVSSFGRKNASQIR